MAHTDFEFYQKIFIGDILDSELDFMKWAGRASDYLDTITFRRLVNGLPQEEYDNKRVQKCVCAIAEMLFQVDEANRVAQASVSGQSSIAVGASEGQVKSKSSGAESISYATPTEMAGGAKLWSAIYAAASDKPKLDALLLGTAKEYLSGISDNSGTLLLYAGM